MKLAEALIEKKALGDKQYELVERFRQSVKIQEGEEAFEDCEALLKELESGYQALKELTTRINLTNQQAMVEGKTMVECLVERKLLAEERESLQKIYYFMTEKDYRLSRAEIKMVLTVNPTLINDKMNRLAKELRLLDTKIQEKNWTQELL